MCIKRKTKWGHKIPSQSQPLSFVNGIPPLFFLTEINTSDIGCTKASTVSPAFSMSTSQGSISAGCWGAWNNREPGWWWADKTNSEGSETGEGFYLCRSIFDAMTLENKKKNPTDLSYLYLPEFSDTQVQSWLFVIVGLWTLSLQASASNPHYAHPSSWHTSVLRESPWNVLLSLRPGTWQWARWFLWHYLCCSG